MLPKEKFENRLSAYGIIKHEGKILLVNTKSTGKWFLPGGEVEIGEDMEDAVKRETYEECGIDVSVGKMIARKKTMFYYDPTDNAWQNYCFFFECTPLGVKLTEDYQVEDDESEKPEWVEIAKLKKDDFQFPVDELFDIINE